MTIFLFVVICMLVYASDPSAYSKLIPSPHRGMSVYAAFCQFFCEKRHDFGYATLVLVKNKLNTPLPLPPPPPPTHTHTHTQLSGKDKQTDTENFRCQEYCGPNTLRGGGGGGVGEGGIYLRCASEIYVLMIWELVRYWFIYYNFTFSRMRLSGKQFTNKPWISKQLPTSYAM